MLVLTRKQKEAIQIGDDIEIVVLSIDGDQVKIGIHAPKSIEIHRQEVYLEIQKENNLAANLSPELLLLLQEEANEKK